MSEIGAAIELLSDGFGRVRDSVRELTDGLSDEAAWFRPAPEANTIAWLVWHLSRVQDDHVADVAGTGQVWPQWRDRFGLPFADAETGYSQSAEEVGQVQVRADLLSGYHEAVQDATEAFLRTLSAADLDRVVDENWDPPVTLAVRLMSVLNDTTQHVGQAAYVRGLAERR